MRKHTPSVVTTLSRLQTLGTLARLLRSPFVYMWVIEITGRDLYRGSDLQLDEVHVTITTPLSDAPHEISCFRFDPYLKRKWGYQNGRGTHESENGWKTWFSFVLFFFNMSFQNTRFNGLFLLLFQLQRNYAINQIRNMLPKQIISRHKFMLFKFLLKKPCKGGVYMYVCVRK